MNEADKNFRPAAPYADTLKDLIVKANFNPFQPRDKQGLWSTSGESASSARTETSAYQGRFHDLVVDDLLDGLRADGSIVLKNVRVLGINGVIAIPDGVSKPKANDKPYFIEVKTGGDPKFTQNQRMVYPLVCEGGHATSLDPRITQLGLTPGKPFPPMRVLLVTTAGPGRPIGLTDYCKAIGLEVP